MPSRVQQLSASDIREQVRRIRHSEAFAGKDTLADRLAILVEMAIRDVPEREFSWQRLYEEFFGKSVAPDVRGKARTRAQTGVRQEVFRVKEALMAYYGAEGREERVVIEFLGNARRPNIRPLRPARPGAKHLANDEAQRLIVQAKRWLDARTLGGDLRALECADRALKVRGAEGAALIGFATTWYAVKPRLAALAAARQALWGKADLTAMMREAGHASWELFFIQACEKARQFAWDDALALIRRAARSSAGEVVAYWWYPALLASRGEFEEAVVMLDGLVRYYNRGSVGLRGDLALVQAMAREFEDAEATLLDVADGVSPGDSVFATHLALVYGAQGKNEEAWKSLVPAGQRLLTSSNAESPYFETHHLFHAVWGLVAGRIGDSATAQRVWESSVADYRGQETTTSAFQVALPAIGANRPDDAIAWLQRAALEDHDPFAMWFHLFPPLRHLRGHPGYRPLLKQLKLV